MSYGGAGSNVNIHRAQPDHRKIIEFYGEEVLPKPARASSTPNVAL